MPQAVYHESRDVIAESPLVQKREGRAAGGNVRVRHILPPGLRVEATRGTLLFRRLPIIHSFGLMEGRTAFTGHAIESRRYFDNEGGATTFKFRYTAHGI